MSPSPWLRRAAAAVAAGALAVAGLALPPPPASAATHEVDILDSVFGTAVLVVQVGDTVVWNNVDDRPHTVTSDDRAFDSGNLDEGASFSHTFTESGTYTYLCEYHPDMRATVVVEQAASATPEPAAADATPASTPAVDAPEARDGGHVAHDGDSQPDTAMPAPRSIPSLAFLLWGAGLVAVGIGLAPPRRSGPVPAPERPAGGWRR